MTSKNLSSLQARFVDEFMVDRNAMQAAIRAGYKVKNVDVTSAVTRNHPLVAAAIAEREKTIADRLGITVERILTERARLAFYDPADAFDADGNPLTLRAMGEDIRRAVAGYEVDGKMVTKVKLERKHEHLTSLERHLGMNTEDGGSGNGALNIHIHL